MASIGRVLFTALLVMQFACTGNRGFAGEGAQRDELTRRLRRPVALALADAGRWLYVANRDSGTISVVDTRQLRTVAEAAVGQSLADLATVADGRRLLCVDEGADELLLIHADGAELKVAQRLPLAHSPVSVAVAAGGSRAYVASLWARRLTIVDLAPAPSAAEVAKLSVSKVVELPFAPRKQLLVRGGTKLIVADSFGGRLGVIDIGRAELDFVHTLPAHNIRGLALGTDEETLLITHQFLNRLAQTSFDDVHWGVLMTNGLREIRLDALLDADADPLGGSRLVQLGDVGTGGGDPAELAVGPGGEVAIALGGVGEVVVHRKSSFHLQRTAVGRRPTDMTSSPDGRTIYVANTYSDSVSVVELETGESKAEITLGPLPELSAAERGEILFHDALLSHDGWVSCQSCHTDGHTNGQLNDNLSDGSFGTPKRVLSLLGVGDTEPWAWNGRVKKLEDQIRKSIELTMRGAAPTDDEVENLAAYLATLEPPPAATVQPGEEVREAIRRGRHVFGRLGCAECHVPPIFTSGDSYDVRLADEVGNVAFNPPSLRGAGQRESYFHDGRAKSLADVFTTYRHQLEDDLADEDLRDLVRFLRSL